MIAQLPGEKEPEFLLMIQFTPRKKQNLIGLMAARSDAEHLGGSGVPAASETGSDLGSAAGGGADQSGSEYFEGPDVVESAGSQVLRSQILTLPIDQTILYVAPIYIQAAQARMPQLRKVALVRGSTRDLCRHV